MGSSVDDLGSSARAPILEVWRHDEEDVITIPIIIIIIFFVIDLAR